MTSTQIVREYIDTIGDLKRKSIQDDGQYKELKQLKNVDIINIKNMEDVVVAYADISITGTDREKPQIRVFMNKIKIPYDFAKAKSMRFFCFSIFSKDKAMAKNIHNYDPHQYLVSLETNIDNDLSRRDIRSMYDFLDTYIGKNGEPDYVRCAVGQHQSGVYQASFIKISDNGSGFTKPFLDYLTYFDSRPYMNSVNDNKEQKADEKKGELKYNRIIFGAPGTGKSHRLEIDSRQFDGRVERVTFHPNYSYAQFVGTYKPVMEIREDKKEISYKYVPGPFMRVYLNAKKNMLLQEEYKDIACRKVYYEPATDMDHWNLFDEVQNIGDMEDFTATKDMGIGDIALIYIGNNDYGYERGVYAIAKVISEPEIDDSEEDGKPRVWLRFDKISYDKPIISKEILDLYNTQYQSVHEIKDGQKLLQDISFGEGNELLIIEEINRANVAAVFGDVFQLLDRKDGVSEYAIATSEDMRQFLDDELGAYDVDNSKMEIPSNMYIWATMNSADQGVFPMDTAFKRRWEFEYISVNDENQVHAIEDYEIPMCANKRHKYYVNWNDLRTEINTILIDSCKVNEDKLLGPFFISKNMLDDIKSNKDQIDRIQATEEALRSDEDNKTLTKAHQNEISFMKAFESKVIMYLFEDVMKMRAERIFVGHAQKNRKMIFSEICEAFEEEGEKIFGIKGMDSIQG